MDGTQEAETVAEAANEIDEEMDEEMDEEVAAEIDDQADDEIDDETGDGPEGGTGDGPRAETGEVPAPIAPENVRLARELAAELRELRGSAARIVENYASRVDARLARLERFASRRGRNGRYLSAPPAKVLTRMLKELRALQVKEGKGRPKDLARLRSLVDELERLADKAEPPPADTGS